MTSDGLYDYTYDAGGNMLTKTPISYTNTATPYAYTFTWDYRNRLTEAVVTDNTGTVIHDEKFTYDVNNNKIGDNLDGTQTWTVYDGQNPYADFNATGSLTTRYLYGNNLDQLFARISAAGVVDWYITDRLGSVRQIVDVGNNTPLDNLVYDAYGNIVSESNATNGDRFHYTAREWDAVLNLQYNRARWYDPATGRFISEDPSGFGGDDTNLFRYDSNSPTNGIDPSGLYEEDVHFYMTYYMGLASGLGDVTTEFNNRSAAYMIAWADAYTDVNPNTEPFGALAFGAFGGAFLGGAYAAGSLIGGSFNWGRSAAVIAAGGALGLIVARLAAYEQSQLFHFALTEGTPGTGEAAGILKQGTDSNNVMLIGIGMHTFQDSWSHEGFGPLFGHLFSGHGPDQPYASNENYEKAVYMAEATYNKLAAYAQQLGVTPLRSWGQIAETIKDLLKNQTSPDDAERSRAWQNSIRKDFGAPALFNPIPTQSMLEAFLSAVSSARI